ncbi:hypothetical protein GQL56_28550, partial [Pseudomonas putida]|nr:hypothetical protein [Pseudomonas putida]
MSKYVKVGTVRQTAEPVSNGTANSEHVEANNHDAKPAEGGASESVKPSENADLCNEASSDSIPAETGNKFDGDADKQE